MFTYYIVITRHRSDIEIICYTKQEANFSLSLPTLHVTLIGIVIAHLIAYSPKISGKRIEIKVIIDAISSFRSNMVTTDTQHIETYRTDITIKRDIRRRKNTVVRISTV